MLKLFENNLKQKRKIYISTNIKVANDKSVRNSKENVGHV